MVNYHGVYESFKTFNVGLIYVILAVLTTVIDNFSKMGRDYNYEVSSHA